MGFFKRLFGVSTEPNSLGNQFRQKRMLFFREVIKDLDRPLRILDVGGNEHFWINAGFHQEPDVYIKILNLEKKETSHPNFEGVAGDATNLSEYADQSFDIAFSNSVIEHLYTHENQVKMALEIVRVGKYHFVQTPNKYFLIEPHYLLPWFQFLPKGLQYFILTKTPFSRGKRWNKQHARQYVDEIRLISKRKYQEMFPQSKIWKERFMGGVKSFIAHNFPLQ